MPGAADSVAEPNIAINTAVSDALCSFADVLEKDVENGKDLKQAVTELLKKEIKEHKRIIFNGNNYSEQWVQEAKRRGLLNLASTPEALRLFNSEKNVAVFEKFGVLSRAEVDSRLEIMYENYRKTIKIEGCTMIDMVNKHILPCAFEYTRMLAQTAGAKKALLPDIQCKAECDTVKKLSELTDSAAALRDELKYELDETKKFTVKADKAMYYRTNVFPVMQKLRKVCDEIEPLIPASVLTYPTYSTLMFSLN